MKLTEWEKKSIEISIHEWERDVQAKPKDGHKIIKKCGVGFVWQYTLDPVNTVDGKTTLCREYNSYKSHNPCEKCPYFKKYGEECYQKGQYWYNFYRRPTLKNCTAFISALRRILE